MAAQPRSAAGCDQPGESVDLNPGTLAKSRGFRVVDACGSAGPRPFGCWDSALASSVRDRTPSLRYSLDRFHSTVRALRWSAAATSRLVRPAATNLAIADSVALSVP